MSQAEGKIVVETWAFLRMMTTEIRKAAGDQAATLAVADRIDGIAQAMQDVANDERREQRKLRRRELKDAVI